VARLADRIREGGIEVPWRTLIAHRPTGRRPPLFAVGAGQMMQGLVHHLDPEVPLFSLNLFGLVPEEGEIPRLGIEAIARACIEDMKRAAPEGPYQLLGYCGDTKLALAIAHQLQAQGDEVGFFGTIDVVGRDVPRQPSLLEAWSLFRDYGWAYPREILTRRRRRYRVLALRTSARIASFADRLVLRDLTKRERHDVFYARYLEARAAYRAKPFSGEVSFFVCSEYYRRTSERALRALTPGPAKIFEVPGFHETLFEPPWVEVLGEQLSRALLR
jgi:thioesterase domain-containing protein